MKSLQNLTSSDQGASQLIWFRCIVVALLETLAFRRYRIFSMTCPTFVFYHPWKFNGKPVRRGQTALFVSFLLIFPPVFFTFIVLNDESYMSIYRVLKLTVQTSFTAVWDSYVWWQAYKVRASPGCLFLPSSTFTTWVVDKFSFCPPKTLWYCEEATTASGDCGRLT